MTTSCGPGPGPGAALGDVPERWPVSGEPRRHRGAFVSMRTDQVLMPGGEVAARDVVEHPGSVAVVALTEPGEVLMIRQYRHPAGWLLWEIPAGLRDVAGEPSRTTAERELREETGYAASQWQVLADCFTSPGLTSERVRYFLARGLTREGPPPDGYQPRHEEAHLVTAWVPLERAVSLVLAGGLHNGVAAVGILAAYAARQSGFAALREAGAQED